MLTTQEMADFKAFVQSLADMTVVKALAWPAPSYSWTGPQYDRRLALLWTER